MGLPRWLLCLFASFLVIGCGSSSEDTSASSMRPQLSNVGTSAKDDPQNTHPNFVTGSGECLALACATSNATITQFKQDIGFFGFTYGLRGSATTTIELDPEEAEQLPIYSGPMTFYTAKHSPVAVRNADYTYFVYSGPALIDNEDRAATTFSGGRSITTQQFLRSDNKANALGVYLARYNHKSSRVSAPMLVHVKHTDDPHDNAVINFDSQGNLYVLISGRSNLRSAAMFYIELPNSATVFSAEQLTIADITPDNLNYQNLGSLGTVVPSTAPITYPKLLRISDGFRLIYTLYCQEGRGQECDFGTRQLWSAKVTYAAATDQQAQLSEVRPLAAFGGHYALAVGSEDGQTIAVAFNQTLSNQVSERTNLYSLISQDEGKTWEHFRPNFGSSQPAEGFLPLNSQEELLRTAVWSAPTDGVTATQRIYLKDIQLNNEGNPVILFLRSTEAHGPTLSDTHELLVAQRDTGQWRISSVTRLVDHNYSTGFVAQDTDGRLAVLFPGSVESLNNGLAGGAFAIAEEQNDQFVVTSMAGQKTPGERGYLTNLCELNYMRAVINSAQSDIVGVASAANSYQFEADSSNEEVAAVPLFLITDNHELLRLPQSLHGLDENAELAVKREPTTGVLNCDSAR